MPNAAILMIRQRFLVLFLALLVPTVFAQDKREQKVLTDVAKELHKYSAKALDKGFPLIARRVWLMLLSEYDPDHAKARTALGYVKAGGAWALDPKFSYPKDDSPDAKAAKSLRSSWKATAKKVADKHKRFAALIAEVRTDRARWHYEKVMFFDPEDKDAQEFLEHEAVAGLTGTELEQTLFKRSKRIEEIVGVEARKEYPVELLETPEPHPILDKARVDYITVKSELFTIHGDFEADLLIEAAKNAERAVRVLNVAFEGYPGFSTEPKRWVRTVAYFQDVDTFKQIVKANSDLMSPDHLKFLVEETTGTTLSEDGTVGTAIGVSAPRNEQGLYDGIVRRVAQAYSGFKSAGLKEGIGHAIVGMFFNNNRAFIVDRKKQMQSSSGEEDHERFSPNMDTWKDLALEAAWKLAEGTPAAQLPLITADKFPDDARIKSWSFCDYIMRRDPTLLTSLDKLAEKRSPVLVEQEFEKLNDGLSLAQLEKEWKDFWTGASPVLKSIQNNTEPLSVVTSTVKKWLAQFNKARKAEGSTPVTWSASYSGRCAEHAAYLLAHEELRGAKHEQTQDIALEEGSHLGDMFAQMALVSTAASKPKDVYAQWMHYPGYRDAILNERLLTIGLYEDEKILVVDVIRGVGRPQAGRGGTRYYPGPSTRGVPTSMDVADLGPELKAFLERHGHGELERVGYPISLHHFGIGGLQGHRESYNCKVTIQGKPVEGIMHLADGGSHRRTSAPGMVVFYPLAPLRKGIEVEVLWTYDDDESTARKVVKFDT